MISELSERLTKKLQLIPQLNAVKEGSEFYLQWQTKRLHAFKILKQNQCYTTA